MGIPKHLLILVVILILGAFLRLYNLDKVPLYGDELTIALDSYSLLKNGTDQLGNPWPVTFEMGAGRPAGYVYGSIPFVALFGPNYLGVRLLSLLSGVGLIYLLYLFSKRFFSEKTALATAFLAATSPWGINLSRAGFETNFALFLLILGTVLVIYLEKRRWYLILSALSFGLVIHAYPTYKLTLPLYLISLLWFTNSVKTLFSKKQILVTMISTLILTAAVVLSVLQTIQNNSESRFVDINIFSSKDIAESITQKINSERTISQIPQLIKPILLNKYLEYAFLYTENYLKNLSFDFLFLHGDGNPRHNMSVSGGFYLVELIFILLGAISLLNKNKRLLVFLISWVMVAPLATALVGNPHFLRSAMMLPPLIILSAMGLSNLTVRLRWILVIIFIAQILLFSQRLYFLAPFEFGRFWSESAKLATDYVEKNKTQYRYVILSDRIDNLEYAYPAYTNIDPKDVINQNKSRSYLSSVRFKQFGNVYIGSLQNSQIQEFVKSLNGNVLYIGSATDTLVLEGADIIHTSDKNPALVIKSYDK